MADFADLFAILDEPLDLMDIPIPYPSVTTQTIPIQNSHPEFQYTSTNFHTLPFTPIYPSSTPHVYQPTAHALHNPSVILRNPTIPHPVEILFQSLILSHKKLSKVGQCSTWSRPEHTAQPRSASSEDQAPSAKKKRGPRPNRGSELLLWKVCVTAFFDNN